MLAYDLVSRRASAKRSGFILFLSEPKCAIGVFSDVHPLSLYLKVRQRE